jgi:hypothetical protein
VASEKSDKGKQMSNMLKWAEAELRLAGYDINDPEDGPNRWLAEGTLELLQVFAEQGHSSMSAPYAVALFEKLAMWKPITPLTGEDDEWMQVSRAGWQNKRSSNVFKGKDGQAYWMDSRVFWKWYSAPDIDDGKPFKSSYTSRDSRVDIEFPWTQPDEREYVFVPTEEFPNEELN